MYKTQSSLKAAFPLGGYRLAIIVIFNIRWHFFQDLRLELVLFGYDRSKIFDIFP